MGITVAVDPTPYSTIWGVLSGFMRLPGSCRRSREGSMSATCLTIQFGTGILPSMAVLLRAAPNDCEAAAPEYYD